MLVKSADLLKKAESNLWNFWTGKDSLTTVKKKDEKEESDKKKEHWEKTTGEN
jgi:hypothetical protein